MITTELCSQNKFECSGVREKPNWYRFVASDGFTVKEFFDSFPVIKVNIPGGKVIKWFPSEYFYEETHNLYCLTVDPFGSSGSMVIGGSMMRQSMYIFDLEGRQLGIVRAHWSEDPFMSTYDDPQYANYVPSNETPHIVPIGPEIPEDQPEPEEPQSPTEPTEPVEPTEPTEPTAPAEPAEPIDSIDPTVPDEPVDPTTPIGPEIPNEPQVANTYHPYRHQKKNHNQQ